MEAKPKEQDDLPDNASPANYAAQNSLPLSYALKMLSKFIHQKKGHERTRRSVRNHGSKTKGARLLPRRRKSSILLCRPKLLTSTLLATGDEGGGGPALPR